METISKNELEKEFNKFIVDKNMHIINESMKSSIYDGFKAGYNLQKKMGNNESNSTLHTIILDNCLNLFGHSKEEIRSKCRTYYLVFIRIAISKMLRDNGYSLSKIGGILNRNHSSIIHLLKTHDNYEFIKEKEYLNVYKSTLSFLKSNDNESNN